MQSTTGVQAHTTPFNSPRWVFKPNVPKRPRLRLRAVGGRNGWHFVIEDANRLPVASDFGNYPSYPYWTDEARTLFALAQAWRWLALRHPGDSPESLVSMTCTEPRREAQAKGRAAA
jgi:hypothetical protein